jgi:hypothetical protein
MRGHRKRAAFVGGRYKPKEQLSAGVIERGEPDLIDLCRHLIWGYLTTVRDEWRGLFATVGVSVADAQSGVVTLRL